MSNTITALQAFRMLDSNRSSSVSSKEFLQGLALAPASLRQAVSKSDAQSLFNQFDTDTNGSLSNNELAQGLALVATDTASALLGMQEQQSSISKLLTGLQVGQYSALNTPQLTNSTAFNVLSAYFNKTA